MPQKMTPDERAAYQRDYRAKRKADEQRAEAARPKTDRELGLPRTNYYSDPKIKGGWIETIQKMDPHLADRILNSPSIKTKR